MHGGDKPLASLFCGGQRYVDGECKFFSAFRSSDISGCQHPSRVSCDLANVELVVKTLLFSVESLKEVLMSRFDFVWTRPDFAGTAAHDCGLVGHGSHYPSEIVVGKGRIVRLEQSAHWFQLGVLGFCFGFLRARNGWNCCGSSDSSYSHKGFFSVHKSNYSLYPIRKTIGRKKNE